MSGALGRAALPVAVVVAAACGLWLATGVELDELARYLGYELAYVIAPGWLLFRAISPSTRSRLTQVAVGWALGLVLEIGLFALTAAVDVRDVFALLPLIVGGPAAFVWWLRTKGRTEASTGDGLTPPLTAPQAWTLAGLCLVAFAYLGLTLIAQAPIPGSVDQVLYAPDSVAHISFAAEAKHHWPLEEPQVAGIPFEYHYLAHLHGAGISQVTGVDLPIVFLRLYMLPMAALILLLLCVAGRAVAGRAWAGPLAAALFLLVWELDLSIPTIAPFNGGNSVWLRVSPSYLLGLIFFIPLLTMLSGLLDERVRRRVDMPGRAPIVLAAILVLGAAGAKPVAVPLVLFGLGVFVLWRFASERRIDGTAVVAGVVGSMVLLAFYLTLYGARSGGLGLGFGSLYELMPALRALEGEAPDGAVGEVAFWAIGGTLGSLLLFVPPLLGLAWVLGPGRPALRPAQVLALGVLAGGFAAWFFLDDEVGNNNYFMAYGVIAAIPITAGGLLVGWDTWSAERFKGWGTVAVALGAWLLVCLGLSYWGWQLYDGGHYARAYAVVYPPVILILVAAAVWAWRSAPAQRAARVALVGLAVVAPAALDLFLDTVPVAAQRLDRGQPLYEDARYGLTPEVYEGSIWIRENIDDDAVLAISNQATAEGQDIVALHTEIPAFAERRAFYEGWLWSLRSAKVGFEDVAEGREQPYPDRARLERAVYERGSLDALRQMQDRYGVTHLVLDRTTGRLPARVREAGRTVFANDGIEVIELAPPSDTGV